MPTDETLNDKALEPDLPDLLEQADRELREIEGELSRLAAKKGLFLALRHALGCLAMVEGERKESDR